MEKFHQYVPYMEHGDKEMPKILDITNHTKRVYLRDEKKVIKEKSRQDFSSVHKNVDSKRFLDLGVAPLQRIINELKSLSSEPTEDHYDHRAAKASGLVDYCDFLRGEGPNNALKFRNSHRY